VVASAPVRVLEQTRVAGLDAAVLAADDAGALASWLSAHGFDFRDSLKRWVAPYLERKWVITAFRYARPADGVAAAGSSLASNAVRISFPADAPVYPYREPDDAQRTAGRELHLFVVADTAVDGAMSDLGDAPWDVRRPFAAPWTQVPAAMAAALPGVELPARAWVTELVDHASSRPPSDVVFAPSRTAGETRRPPITQRRYVDVPLPYELPFVALGVGWWLRRRRRLAAVRAAVGESYR
jgi:hypothetical protein